MNGRQAQEKEGSGHPDTSNKKSPYRVLLIEDEEAHTDLIRHSFSDYLKFFSLSAAATLQEARQQIAQEPFDLVIADLLLPDGKGIDIQPADKDAITIPVIIMTSHGNEELAVEMFKAGAVNYIVKSEAAFRNLPRIAERAIGEWENIRERKEAEEALRESEERFRRISSLISNFAFSCRKTMDNGYVIDWLSGPVEQITGFSVDEIKAMLCWRSLVIDEDLPVFDRNVTGLLPGESASSELCIRHKTGRVVWLETFSECVLETNDPASHRLYGACRDITDRKLMESEIRSLNTVLEQRVEQRTAELASSLEDKIVLLREVHHRVKNNLQIIISLLNLQSRYIEDEKTRQVFHESQNRIMAMALVHEKLYLSTDMAVIDLDNYIRFLGDSLFQFYGMQGKGIVLTTGICDINIGINTAIPIGLIVNELVSNSLKHAFPRGRNGEISIAVKRENNSLSILFADNGVGIPQDLDWRNGKSLGLRLVISLVEQLSGTIELDRTAGTAFTIVVKEKK